MNHKIFKSYFKYKTNVGIQNLPIIQFCNRKDYFGLFFDMIWLALKGNQNQDIF